MNKKETLEIRKQFTNENCAITRICGCYVDAEKQIRTELKEAFLSLPEEEIFKYYEIFRKTLSGTIGKNLLNMEFPLAQEMPDGTQSWLLKLRDSRLTDDVRCLYFHRFRAGQIGSDKFCFLSCSAVVLFFKMFKYFLGSAASGQKIFYFRGVWAVPEDPSFLRSARSDFHEY